MANQFRYYDSRKKNIYIRSKMIEEQLLPISPLLENNPK